MKKNLAVMMAVLAVVLFGVSTFAAAPSLDIQGKKTFKPGETITVKFEALPSFATNAWVGVIPSGTPHGSEATNDQHDLSYKYLQGKKVGTLTFAAPNEPGKYDLRMNDTDSNGKEVAYVSFTVGSGPAAGGGLKYNVGDRVSVEWKGSWYPAAVIAVNADKGTYKIHYDGYSSSWDEWVGNNRIKK